MFDYLRYTIIATFNLTQKKPPLYLIPKTNYPDQIKITWYQKQNTNQKFTVSHVENSKAIKLGQKLMSEKIFESLSGYS